MARKADPIPKARDLIAAIQFEGLRQRIAVNRKDGSVLVYVPEGEFEMGEGKDSDCPKHRVYLSAY